MPHHVNFYLSLELNENLWSSIRLSQQHGFVSKQTCLSILGAQNETITVWGFLWLLKNSQFCCISVSCFRKVTTNCYFFFFLLEIQSFTHIMVLLYIDKTYLFICSCGGQTNPFYVFLSICLSASFQPAST